MFNNVGKKKRDDNHENPHNLSAKNLPAYEGLDDEGKVVADAGLSILRVCENALKNPQTIGDARRKIEQVVNGLGAKALTGVVFTLAMTCVLATSLGRGDKFPGVTDRDDFPDVF